MVNVNLGKLPGCVPVGRLINMIMCSSVLFIIWYAMLCLLLHDYMSCFLFTTLIAPQILGNKTKFWWQDGSDNIQHSHKSKTTTNLLIHMSQSKSSITNKHFFDIPFWKKKLCRAYRLNCKVCFSALNNQRNIPSAILKHCMMKITKVRSLWGSGSSSLCLHN